MTNLFLDYLSPPTPDQQRLLDIMRNIRVPPLQRAQAGRDLAKLGDPRQGVGVLPNGIPDIVWCEVPGQDKGVEASPIGGDAHAYDSLPSQTVNLDTYWIAKYPITSHQYQAFIDARGYDTAEWWEGLTQYVYYGQHFQFGNHPRETITWYEAVAFCRWLSAKTDMAIRLPTEEEWEKAARGVQGLLYPWGNTYESGRANIYEVEMQVGEYYLKTTTAVGLYPHGASPYGVLDMAGNVWEWTSSAWLARLKHTEHHPGFPVHDTAWVLRGGAWDESDIFARSASRSTALPLGRNFDMGFRVVSLTDPDGSL